jgi:hypothetical protein
MLKDRRLEREGGGEAVQAKGVKDSNANLGKKDTKKEMPKTPAKGAEKNGKGDKKGKGEKEKPQPVVEEEVLVTEPEKIKTPELTDDEEDSIIDDLQEPDYTHKEAYYRRNDQKLVPDSNLSA